MSNQSYYKEINLNKENNFRKQLKKFFNHNLICHSLGFFYIQSIYIFLIFYNIKFLSQKNIIIFKLIYRRCEVLRKKKEIKNFKVNSVLAVEVVVVTLFVAYIEIISPSLYIFFFSKLITKKLFCLLNFFYISSHNHRLQLHWIERWIFW